MFLVLSVLRYILWADDRYDSVNPLTALYGKLKILKSMLTWITRPGVTTGIIWSECTFFCFKHFLWLIYAIQKEGRLQSLRQKIPESSQAFHIIMHGNKAYMSHGEIILTGVSMGLVCGWQHHTQPTAMYHTDPCPPLISVMSMSLHLPSTSLFFLIIFSLSHLIFIFSCNYSVFPPHFPFYLPLLQRQS